MARLRSWLLFSTILTVVGIVLALNDSGGLAAPATLVGASLLIWSVHRLGRSGPEGTTESSDPQQSHSPRS